MSSTSNNGEACFLTDDEDGTAPVWGCIMLSSKLDVVGSVEVEVEVEAGKVGELGAGIEGGAVTPTNSGSIGRVSILERMLGKGRRSRAEEARWAHNLLEVEGLCEVLVKLI